jgi:hypothetical protein
MKDTPADNRDFFADERHIRSLERLQSRDGCNRCTIQEVAFVVQEMKIQTNRPYLIKFNTGVSN